MSYRQSYGSSKKNKTLKTVGIIIGVLLLLFLLFLAFDYFLKLNLIIKQPQVDCQYNDWSDWSDCSEDCGGGTQSRSRTIKTPSTFGGQECDTTSLTDQQECNTDTCAVPPRTATELTSLEAAPENPALGHLDSGVARYEGKTYCNFTGDDYAVGLYGTDHAGGPSSWPFTGIGLMCASGNRSPLIGSSVDPNPDFEFSCPSDSGLKGVYADGSWVINGLQGRCDDPAETLSPHIGGYVGGVVGEHGNWQDLKCPAGKKLVGIHGYSQLDPEGDPTISANKNTGGGLHDRFGWMKFICQDIPENQ